MSQIEASAEASSPVALPPGLDGYRRHVAHLNLQTDRETAMILAVWSMMESFVDRAVGHDPVQLAQNAGDALPIPRVNETLPVIASKAIQTQTHDHLSKAFGAAADVPDGRKRCP